MLLPSIHSESPALKPAFRRSVTFVAGFAIAIGAMWLLAWAIGIPQRLVNTSIITMKTNMALALLLSGTSLLLIGVPNSRPWRRLAGGSAGAIVFLIGALTLYEHLFQQSLGIDQLFFTEPPGATSILSPNRMGPPGAISLVLIGSALLTLVGRRRAVTPYLGLLVCLISLVPAVGYLYGARAFYGNAYLTVIAWPTIPALMALGIGLVLACPVTGPMPMLLRGDAGGALLRHLLPATLVVPVVLGYVRTRGEMAGLYGASTGRALLILSLIVVFSTLLWVSATRLSMLAAAERAGQESLLRSEERFRAFVNASSDVVYSMNADWSEMRQLDGRGFLSDTPSPSRQWVEEYIEPEDRAQVLSAIQSAIRTKSVYELEHRIRRADGKLGWTLSRAVPMLNDRGEIAEWFGTAINVTVRKQAEMKLREALEHAELERLRLSTVLEALPAGVAIAEADGRVSHFNAALARIWGSPPTPSSTREYREWKGYWLDNGKELTPDEWAMARVLRTGETVPGDLIEIERFDGTGRATIINAAAPIRDPEGRIVGGVITELDITAEKRATEALAESERRYRLLFESMLNGVAHCRMLYDEKGRPTDFIYLYVNSAFESLTDRKEVSGKRYSEVFPGAQQLNPELLESYARVVATGHSEKFEIYFKALAYWYSVTAYRTEPDHFVIIFDNITERKRSEEVLRQNEERVRAKLNSIVSPGGDVGNLELADIIDVPTLQELFDHFYAVTKMPVAVLDLGGKVLINAGWQESGAGFHRQNPETCQHCIQSDSEMSVDVPAGEYKIYRCNNHMWDVATPVVIGDKHLGNVFTGQFLFDDEEPDVEDFRAQARRLEGSEAKCLAALERVPRLSRERLANGMACLMKLTEIISRLSYSNLKLARSLTERSRLTVALRESEARFRAVAENVPEIIWVADAEASFLYLSPKWLEYTGTTADQNANDQWLQRVHPEDRDDAAAAWRTAVESSSSYEVEYRLRRHDGEYRWHIARAVPMPDTSSGRLLWFGTTTDIEEQKLAQEILIRNEKLASAGRMAATVAHEINNPLATVTNLLYLLRKDISSESGQQLLSAAEAELAQVGQITRQTLGFYRDSSKPARFKVAELLEEILSSYKGKLKQSRIVVCRHYEPADEIEALRGEMRQVFSNLIANAIDAMPDGGTLDLRISRAGEDDRHTIQVEVRDTGTGIQADNRTKIFEPFFTTKQDVGTGLGLWVVKEILKRHGGTVDLRSSTNTDDHGTCFLVCLPRRWEFRLV